MKKFTRYLAILLAACMLFAMLPTGAKAVDGVFGTVTDPHTINNWMEFMGPDAQTTAYSGGIWVDKSVFGDDETEFLLASGADVGDIVQENNFLVSLSALASNKTLDGLSHIPTDTIFVLDVSGSMADESDGTPSDEAVQMLASALNTAITKLNDLNINNRVGVVFFNGTSDLSPSTLNEAVVLLPLGRYSHATDNFFVVQDNAEYEGDYWDICLNTNVKDEDGNTVSVQSEFVNGGTYIQAGLQRATDQFLNADPIVREGLQAGTERQPILIFMGDGGPTTATSDFMNIGTTNAGVGRGSSASDVDTNAITGFFSQLTAVWTRYQLDQKYTQREPLFYTLEYGYIGTVGSMILNPTSTQNHHMRTMWDEYLEATVANGQDYYTFTTEDLTVANGLAQEKGGLLDFYDTATNWAGNVLWNDCYQDSYSVPASVAVQSVEDFDYVDEHFSAHNPEELLVAFTEIIDRIIIQSLYEPTYIDRNLGVDLSGYLEFTDTFSEYMEVEDVEAIVLEDDIITGASFASLLTDPAQFGTVDNPTALGNAFYNTIKTRTNIADRQTVIDLIDRAYNEGILYYNSPTDYGACLGWYTDADGKYLAFWDGNEDTAAANAPQGAAGAVKSYGFVAKIDGYGYYEDSNLLYSYIDVKFNIADGKLHQTKLTWGLPAALIPLVTYHITMESDTLLDGLEIHEGDKGTMEIHEASPIRLLYEVALREEFADPVTINAMMRDRPVNADAYKYDADTNTYTYYTNMWNAEDLGVFHSDVNDYRNAIAYFEPNLENECYYYTYNMPLYLGTDTGADVEFELYKGDTPAAFEMKDTDADGIKDMAFYRCRLVFEWSGNQDADGNYTVTAHERYELVDALDLDAARQDNNGTWYIPKNTVYHSTESYYLEKIASQINADGTVTKVEEANPTDTLCCVTHPQVDRRDGNVFITSELGNNGAISITSAQGIAITKDTDVDTGEGFTFTVTGLGRVAGTPYTMTLIKADGTRTQTTGTFDENGSLSAVIHSGDTIYFTDIALGKYTVQEDHGENYVIDSIYISREQTQLGNPITVEVLKNSIVDLSYTNHICTSISIPVQKLLEYADGTQCDISPAGYQFVMENVATGQTVTVTTDENGQAAFDLTYYLEDAGKTHQYKIYESTPSAFGIAADESIYELNVEVIWDEDTKTMTAAPVLTLDAQDASDVIFTNVAATDITVEIPVRKRLLNEDNKTSSVAPEGFVFAVEDTATGDLYELVSDENGICTFTFPFTHADVGTTRRFVITEVDTNRAHVTYSKDTYEVAATIGWDEENNALTYDTVVTCNDKLTQDGVIFINQIRERVPDTSDHRNLSGWMLIIATAALGISATLAASKRRNRAK